MWPFSKRCDCTPDVIGVSNLPEPTDRYMVAFTVYRSWMADTSSRAKSRLSVTLPAFGMDDAEKRATGPYRDPGWAFVTGVEVRRL